MIKIIIKHVYSRIIKYQLYSSGKGLRVHFPIKIYNPGDIKIGNNVSIFEDCWFNCINADQKPSLMIGNNSSIGRFSHINAYKSVIIENDVSIAERVHISDANHIYKDKSIPISSQGTEFSGNVLIKQGAWIGSGSVILPGVTIGKNSVVGANSVVTKNIKDYSVCAGNPAVLIK